MLSSSLAVIASRISTQAHLKQLHAQIILLSRHHDNYCISLLVTHCTRLHAPLSYARAVFHSAYSPNVYVYTSMLKFYSHLGSHYEVLSLFHTMQRDGLSCDAFVYPIVIKSADKLFTRLHPLVLKLGHGSDRFVRNAIMDMYGKLGPIEIARRLFDEMPDRAIADWNSMISGYWRWRLEAEARHLFESMPEDGRNVVTWTAMVTGYSNMKDLKSARRYFDEMPEKSIVSWNSMLSGYAQNGFVEEALSLFGHMMRTRVRPDETTWVTMISSCSSRGDPQLSQKLLEMLDREKIHLNCFVKTALLDMHAKCGRLETARKIFDELGIRRNSVTWNAMISAYARHGDLISARELFDKMPDRNVVSWNSMITGYAQNGQSPLAIQLFKEMVESSLCEPDDVTMVSVLSACGHLGALELGNWVANYLASNNLELSISGYNALIFMYSKCGSMSDAKRIFQSMALKDAVSYNTLIVGLAAHGNGAEALELFSVMKDDNILPDDLTFVGVLTACSHAGLVQEGRRIFESIDCPSVDHYACMIDLLGRVGKLDEAIGLTERMPMEPHAGVYGSLLNASRIHKIVEVGELAAAKLFELEPNNSGNYVLLSNIYAVAGRWDDARRIRDAMKERGVKKATGWSWVEYQGKMHKFIAGERSHERSEDIYRVLSELRMKTRLVGYAADRSCVLTDVEEEEKELMVGTHSEKLAISFALLVTEPSSVIRVVKNLRVCSDCHVSIKMISKLEGREIIVRDNNRFHHFKDGHCSCNDYW